MDSQANISSAHSYSLALVTADNNDISMHLEFRESSPDIFSYLETDIGLQASGTTSSEELRNSTNRDESSVKKYKFL